MLVKGKITRIVSLRENWAAVVLSDIPQEILIDAGFPISKKEISAAGNICDPFLGATFIFDGEFVNDPRYGRQFKVERSKVDLTTGGSLFYFLTSDFVNGCGEKTAKALIDKFGDETLEIIMKRPEEMLQVSKIGKSKAEKIHTSVANSQRYYHMMELFNERISANKCKKIYEVYKEDYEKVIKTDPYRLIYDIKGFGFLTVDRLALSSGISLNDPKRIRAGIVHTLEEMADNYGHCYMLIEELGANVRSLVKNIPVSDECIAEQISELYSSGYLFCIPSGNTIRIYLESLYKAERRAAEKISALKNNNRSTGYDEETVDEAIRKIEISGSISFELLQREAVHRSFKNHISIITGGPGTGKSTIINAITNAAEKLNMEIHLVAPTGRASRRLAEATGRSAMTVCKFNNMNRKTEFQEGIFVVDETSMVDIETAEDFLSHLSKNCIVILVGDIDQLPPIGPGNFFKDLVNSKMIPYTKLQFSHRFSGLIAQNAAVVNKGGRQLRSGYDFTIINSNDKLARQKYILDEYYKALRAEKGDYRKVQIIVPMRTRGETAANRLNELIREKVNPYKKGDAVFGRKQFRVNDRVMQMKNNYKIDVANGDCGIVKVIDTANNKMTVDMDVGGLKEYQMDDTDDLSIAYAITVHKSQGSEYNTVICSYGTNDFVMLKKKLIYTAITRAKNKMIMIHDPKALIIAVNNIEEDIRHTSLVENIKFYDSLF